MIVVAKAEFKQNVTFHQQIGRKKLRKKLMKCYIWSIALCGAETKDTWESGSDITWKLWNVVLEKDGEDQLDRSCEKLRSIT